MRRNDIHARLVSKDQVSLFIPQGDPPIIRVAKPERRTAYFTVGELVRWRFLRDFPSYPLKPHQEEGVLWLLSQKTAILADDMGLGKTLQAIAAFEQIHRAGKAENALIICPKSLIGVWEAELNLWAPRLCAVALHSPLPENAWAVLPRQCQVAITNYEAIRSSGPAPEAFDALILDEVHRLKNAKSLNYAACYRLRPKLIWGLSGTPLENKRDDLTAILHLLDRTRISLADARLPLMSLRSIASAYILRRDKQAIATELPQVLEKLDLVPLAPAQRSAYEGILLNRSSYSTVGGWISTFNRLRGVCDFDPSTGASSKIDRALVILESVVQLQQKAVVFSWRIKPLRLLHDQIAERWGEDTVEMITGRTSSTHRSSIVSSFQSKETPAVLLCSMRATSEGLTLTAANNVIFLNEWWNPAINAQARDRVNRIGQTKDVFVHRLRTSGTIETHLADILTAKSTLFEKVVNGLTTQYPHDAPVPQDLRKVLEGEFK